MWWNIFQALSQLRISVVLKTILFFFERERSFSSEAFYFLLLPFSFNLLK